MRVQDVDKAQEAYDRVLFTTPKKTKNGPIQSFRVLPEVEVHQSYHFWFWIDVVVQIPYENSFKSAKYELEENYFLSVLSFQKNLSNLSDFLS